MLNNTNVPEKQLDWLPEVCEIARKNSTNVTVAAQNPTGGAASIHEIDVECKFVKLTEIIICLIVNGGLLAVFLVNLLRKSPINLKSDNTNLTSSTVSGRSLMGWDELSIWAK